MEDTRSQGRVPLGPRHLADPVHLLALGFGAGLAPVAPGTAGTVVGVALYLAVSGVSPAIYLAVVAGVSLAGVWICGRSAAKLGVHDHPAIVWDEIAGYLVTMIAAPPGWGWIVAGFLLFRLLDITKPWPIRNVDRDVPGGTGIMLDDLLAGAYAALGLQGLHYGLLYVS